MIERLSLLIQQHYLLCHAPEIEAKCTPFYIMAKPIL